MMSLEVILLFCAFTVHSTTSQPVLDASASNVGIIGGHRQFIMDAPFMASVRIWDKEQSDVSFRCGGSIIHKQFIMSATHWCKGAKKIEISVGSDKYLEGTIYAATDTYTHTLFDERTYNYDICLIKLNDTLTFGFAINKITLGNYSVQLHDGDELNALGWGRTQDHGNISNDLREVSLPFVSEMKCSNMYMEVTANMICAGAKNKDTCGGDSGGPLTLNNSIQVGITSFGRGNCGKVGMYTKVAALQSWINNVIHKYSK